MHRHRILSASALVLVLLGVLPVYAPAVDPAARCEAGKLKEVAKYSACRLKAQSKAVLTMATADFTKCEAKFPSKFNRIETKAGPGICPSENDGAVIDRWATSDSGDLGVLLSDGATSRVVASGQLTSYGPGDDGSLRPGKTLQYVDNGDGTITDNNTGLMWERKVAFDGTPVQCFSTAGSCANPHDADNGYSWSAAATAPYNGSVVTIFLDQLNNRCSNDTLAACATDADCAGVGGPCGFAGYRDWRLPSVKELLSIVDYSKAPPVLPIVQPAFAGVSCGPGCSDVSAAACGCTADGGYWSSTTHADNPIGAIVVTFDLGDSEDVGKQVAFYARAVRGR